MPTRLTHLEQRYEKTNHSDLFFQAKHTLEALDELVNKHRQFTAIQAVNGVKINGGEESVFYSTMVEVKDIIIDVLEKTIDDVENKWDKNYEKNYKDELNQT